MGILQSLFGGSSSKIGAVPGWESAYNDIKGQQTGLGLAGKLAKRTLRFFNDPGGADYTEAPGFAPMAQAIKASAAGAQEAGDRNISRRMAFESPESGAALGASMSAENAGRIGAGMGSTMANALTNYRSGAESTFQGAKNEMDTHNLNTATGAGQFFLGAHPTMTSSSGGIIPGIAGLLGAGGGLASGLAKFAKPSP